MILTLAAILLAQPGNAFWNDVAAEDDFPRDRMARAYCEWRADLCPMVRRAMHPHVSNRELARIERAAPGYAPGDVRCTAAYQRETNREFIADDAPNCPNLTGRNGP